MAKYRTICEHCKRELPRNTPTPFPSGWTFVLFCSIVCLEAWRKP